MNKKKCTRCHRLLPLSKDYFYATTGGYSLRSECKDCCSLAAKRRKEKLMREGKWMEPTTLPIGNPELIKRKRLIYKFTRAALSELIGVAEITLGKWEDGFMTRVSREPYLRLCNILEINVETNEEL